MHLLPYSKYKTDTVRPSYLTRIPFQVTNTAGLEVRGTMNANAAVTRTIALNQQVYLKIVDPIWAMVLNEANPSLVTTEYVIFGGSVSELAPVPFIESPDTIVTLDHPVDAGELLGYPGFFMNESPTEGQPIIHFEIFTDTDIAALQRGAPLGGESRIIRVQGATNLRKGKLRYNSLNDVPQLNTVGEALNSCEVEISVSEKTKVHLIGDPQIDSLEQTTNTKKYTGPVIENVTKEIIGLIHHWLDNNYRCPVVVEVWNTINKQITRTSLIKSNIWHYDDSQLGDSSQKMFVKDFTNYYDIPITRFNEEMSILGYFFSYNTNWKGPVAIGGHFWKPEAKITIESLVGNAPSTNEQESTYQIVRYIAQNECIGFFDCVNSYDRCIVSFGPCHWTLCLISNGIVEEGELGGYLSYLQNFDLEAFNRSIGFFGIKAEDWNSGFGNGSNIYQSQRKFTGWIKSIGDDFTWKDYPKIVDDVNYFKTWHWFHRFSFAGRTIDGYRRRMYDMTRIRIRDIKTCPWPVNVNVPWPSSLNVTIGDVLIQNKQLPC
jgi:hypothetical protein